LKVLKLKAMKPLKNHTLLYDTQCPLCAAYTSGFIRAGMLDQSGRTPYEDGIELYGATVDPVRARNEIALVNNNDGSVMYGLDSLRFIIGHQSALLKKWLNCKLLLMVLRQFYAFISFNRKVIAPVPQAATSSCVPEFHIGYRLAYLLFASLLVSFTWFRSLSYIHLPSLQLQAWQVACFFSGQLVFQAMLLGATRYTRTSIFDYLGHLCTSTLVGSFALIPVGIFSATNPVFPTLLYGCCLLAALLSLFIHQKRIRRSKAPYWLNFSLLIYDGLTLTLIL